MSRLLEVWGDTVDSRHMAASIGLGVGLATPTFLLAQWAFTATVDDTTLARSYALLAGLAGCLLAGFIAARLFRPKRVVRLAEATVEGRRRALAEIAGEGGEWSNPADLPDAVKDELRALKLYDDLAAAYEQGIGTGAQTEDERVADLEAAAQREGQGR